ncbi:DUF6602 domain-containing protein [Cohnella sp. REN36]|uniref:DUF6602 domain-containing protein n=1 Tax=Cohnella sp. REN36 TaxID=2887347 RepID=UPI001D15AE87|nr:DUF6602 domain-containing protein [Cohnella sp. REN36]MCC3377150.1 hypothetical protein [Cohnella sp. REN36]
MKKIDLRDIFLRLQKQMIVTLQASREIIDHPGSKGDASELKWIEWLENYLPNRYKVGKAFVVDSQNNISDQMDLVIYDRQYTPFVYVDKGTAFIPAESVYAVFEVKQNLSTANIRYAGEKFESVRKLVRTSADIYHLGGRGKKEHFRIISGFVCLSSDFSPAFSETCRKHIMDLQGDQRMDLGCVLQESAFKVTYGSDTEITISSHEETLIFFFFKLIMELQKLGTAPAMDIEEYAKALDSI